MKKKYDQKLKKKIEELIDRIEKNDVVVRIEKGNFKSSLCIVENQKILLINKNLDQAQIIDFMESFIDNDQNILQAS